MLHISASSCLETLRHLQPRTDLWIQSLQYAILESPMPVDLAAAILLGIWHGNGVGRARGRRSVVLSCAIEEGHVRHPCGSCHIDQSNGCCMNESRSSSVDATLAMVLVIPIAILALQIRRPGREERVRGCICVGSWGLQHCEEYGLRPVVDEAVMEMPRSTVVPYCMTAYSRRAFPLALIARMSELCDKTGHCKACNLLAREQVHLAATP